MKNRTKTILGAGLLILLGAALLFAIFYRMPTALVSESKTMPLRISAVRVGENDEDISSEVDLEQMAQLLRDRKGRSSIFPNGSSRIQLTEDMIQLDGDDAKGPVHVVLSSQGGYLYRRGWSRRVKILNWEELYEEAKALLDNTI